MVANRDERTIHASDMRLLCDFANTLDVDVDADPPEALPDEQSLTEWLRDNRLLESDVQAGPDDLDLALTLRDGLRHALREHCDGAGDAGVAGLESIGKALPLRVEFDGTSPRLVPAVHGIQGGLAQILLAVVRAQAEGTWPRYKLCLADDCALAFYDQSKNRSRHWCSMGACGNRQKTRNFRARKKTNR